MSYIKSSFLLKTINMKTINSRTYSVIHLLLMISFALVIILFMTNYYKSYYFFSLFILSFTFYSSKIILIKYNPNKTTLIHYMDYLVFGTFIIQTIIIRLFISVENFYIQLDKNLFPLFYSNGIITSIWPLGIGIFILFHSLNNAINKPILFIASYLVIIFVYMFIFSTIL